MPTLDHFFGIRGIDAPEGRAAQVLQVHARIVQQVGFRDVDPPSVPHGETGGQQGDIVLPRAQGVDLVVGLERIQVRVGLRVVPDIGDRGFDVFREAEFGLLVTDGEPVLCAGDETPGHAGVVGAEDEVEGLVPEGQLVEVVPHGRALVDRRGETVVHAAVQCFLKTDGPVVGGPVRQLHGQPGRGHDGHAVPVQGVGDLRSGVYAEAQVPVGRSEFEMVRRGRVRGARQERGTGEQEQQRSHGSWSVFVKIRKLIYYICIMGLPGQWWPAGRTIP